MKSLNRFLVQVMFVVALALIWAAPASAEQRRFSVPEGTDLVTLVEDAQVIDFEVDTSPPEPATTASIGDVHAVYPVALAVLRDTLIDFAAHPDFMPRVAESRAVQLSEDPAVWEQRVRLVFRVLIFSSEYDFTMTVSDAQLAQRGQFGLYYQMDESLDNRLHNVIGSWYMREVEVNGQPHTYLRYFNSIHFARDQFGLRLALRNQGARDMQNTMNALYEEAKRRR
ncbi:MAG: hypothetical protein EA404_12470 [Spirochaetaceae bacterium]|nr:MAG: hypothetical protein EA404_12470 [Spirochaetaceae bacterium]